MPISAPSAEGHALLGFSKALAGDLIGASEQSQFALSINRQDQFSIEMNKHVMDQITKEAAIASSSDSDDDEPATQVNRIKPPGSFTFLRLGFILFCLFSFRLIDQFRYHGISSLSLSCDDIRHR